MQINQSQSSLQELSFIVIYIMYTKNLHYFKIKKMEVEKNERR